MALPIAVLVSGSGSNLQALIDRIEQGALDARIALVLSNKEGAYGLERARKHRLPHVCIPHADYPDRAEFDRAMIRAIRKAGGEAVVMAGFMRMITGEFLRAFPGKVINIHPALLPSFPGVHGPRDAADYGVAISGCTVHFVDEIMDHGPVIIQAAVPAYPEDDGQTLGGRILACEHRVLPQAVQWLATDRLRLEGRKVRVQPAPVPKAGEVPGALVNPPLELGF
ncbi:phosphoribosylglycinamide formyltransferase [Fundidesulfovibrio terrae]|uniref:phosphoribosylglycinamide formyltransferase n=1 Tax=Fundidesulfovibrio terrae TaxID=2922866 RepID=UPI001FAF2557